MSESQFPYSINNTNKKDNDESDSSEKGDKHFKLQTFIKFKPKVNENKEKDNSSLKSAENQVRSLLSDYLKNFELEKKNDNSKKPKYHSKITNSNISKTNKRRNTVMSNINLKNNNRFKNTDHNNNKKIPLVFNINHKKSNKNISSTLISSPKHMRITTKRKTNWKNMNDYSFNSNFNNLKSIKIKEKINENNKTLQFNLNKNKKNSSKDIRSNKSLNKDSPTKSHSISAKSLNNTKNENLSQINIKTKNASNDTINHQRSELFNKLFKERNKRSRNNLFNESYHNSILTEGSECYINQKSIELKNEPDKNKNKINISNIFTKNNRLSLNGNNEDISPFIKKKNSMYLSQINYKNFLVKGSSHNRKISVFKNNIKKDFKHSISTDTSEKFKYISNKFFKNNAKFKSVKEKLKESIILRPEDIESPQDKNKKKLTNRGNSIKNEINNQTVKNVNNSVNIKNTVTKTTKTNEIESEQALKSNKLNNNETSKKEIINFFPKNTLKRNKSTLFERYRNLYYKPNIYDSLDDDEIEDEDDESIIYIDPNSKFALIFDGVLFITSIIAFVETPFYLAMTHDFCKEQKFTILSLINIFTEFLYIMDLFLGFFRAYYNWEEQLVTKHRYIIKKYLTNWFILDLISAIPIYLINRMNEPYCNDYELKTYYYNIVLDNLYLLFICNKLLKLIKVHTSNQAVKFLSNKINDRTKMIFVVFIVIFFLNYSACLYIFIARNSYPNWILQTKLGTRSFQHIYICSIYILIMAITTVGYGDITCYSFNERIYQLFLLVVGIGAYSYAVSAVSNYVQKINEKSSDFMKKKSILDEIKLNNPNLPEELYDRILRHLIYKNINEKKQKNIIFDCLPVSLKNDLISEMYKPIIKNFIFFKNFQNKDFIVRVILAFKAIMAYKNDILVTEGDMMEDIIFVKKGVLSVELPINITNPQVNIDRYLNVPLLNIENSHNTDKKWNNMHNMGIPGIIDIKKTNDSKRRFSAALFGSNFDSSKNNSYSHDIKPIFNNKEKDREEEEIRYVKILGIRNNEHFGDVLIFLEERSPLRLRVRSKKCELFFLKKIDAIKISNSHPNIWRRINKKSIYNFKQIQKCIIKIVEIYCSVKKVKTKSEISLYDELINQGKIKKENILNISIQSNVSPINKPKINKSHSLDFSKNNLFCNILNKKDIKVNSEDKKNIKNQNISLQKDLKRYKLDELNIQKNILNLSSSSSFTSDKLKTKKNLKRHKAKKNKKNHKNKKNQNQSSKLEDKLIDVYNGKYKYYKGMNNDYTKKKTIIPEQPGIEETISINNKKKLSLERNSLFQYGNKRKSNFFNQESSSSSKTLKLNESYTLKFFKDKNNELIDNNDNEEKSNITSDESVVNKEINPGEEIKINNEKVLLFDKKFKNSFPKKVINNELSNKIDKDSKLQILLKSFIKEKESYLIDEKSNDNSNENQFYSNKNNINLNNYIISNRNILSSIKSQSTEKDINLKVFKNDILSVNTNISFEYEPSYENCNLIASEKLINNKTFQEKLKNFLINEVLGLNNYNSVRFKKLNSLFESNNKETSNTKFQSSINQKEKEKSSVLSIHTSPNLNKNKKKLKRCSSLLEPQPVKLNVIQGGIKRTSSFKENNFLKNKIIYKYDLNIDNNNNNSQYLNKGRKSLKKNRFMSRQDLIYSFKNINSTSKDIRHKKLIRKKSWYNSPNLKPKKKKNDLLSQIDFNIEKTNQNLNNPEEFYSNYFNYLLEEKINYSGFFGQLKNDDSKSKNEKPLKKNNTIRKIK